MFLDARDSSINEIFIESPNTANPNSRDLSLRGIFTGGDLVEFQVSEAVGPRFPERSVFPGIGPLDRLPEQWFSWEAGCRKANPSRKARAPGRKSK